MLVRFFILFGFFEQSQFPNPQQPFALFRERFYEGEVSTLNPETCGLVVQLGRTSPSRGEDHRFKSGPAHHQVLLLCFCVVQVTEKVY